MSEIKKSLHDGVDEMSEKSKETTEVGSKMVSDAAEIDSLLKSIEVQDDSDVSVIESAISGYRPAFEGAMEEQVETRGQEIESQGGEIKESAEGELENVKDGIGNLEQAESVSDIGRDVAESGKSALESSAEEYEDISHNAEQVADETRQTIDSLTSDLRGLFG